MSGLNHIHIKVRQLEGGGTEVSGFVGVEPVIRLCSSLPGKHDIPSTPAFQLGASKGPRPIWRVVQNALMPSDIDRAMAHVECMRLAMDAAKQHGAPSHRY